MSLSLDDILNAADEHRASDVFLMEGEIPRMKINGQLMLFGDEPMLLAQMTGLWQACGASPDTESDKDSVLISSSQTRYRANLHKAMGRLGAIMRRLRTDLPVLGNLGVPDWLLTRWAGKNRGLILITGPTGMGQNTTMAALLQWMNEASARHIVTIEDPIEFMYSNKSCMFTQREVGRDTASYARGVRAAMRQAPDVIMVGEIRDHDTMSAILQACEHGHLVIASVHSDSVQEALEHLTRLFPTDQTAIGMHLLSLHLIGAFCQKLIPRVDGAMHLLVEYLENSSVVKPWLAGQDLESIRKHMQRGKDPNCCAFLTNIMRACEAGFITEIEAINACGNEDDFMRAAQGVPV